MNTGFYFCYSKRPVGGPVLSPLRSRGNAGLGGALPAPLASCPVPRPPAAARAAPGPAPRGAMGTSPPPPRAPDPAAFHRPRTLQRGPRFHPQVPSHLAATRGRRPGWWHPPHFGAAGTWAPRSVATSSRPRGRWVSWGGARAPRPGVRAVPRQVRRPRSGQPRAAPGQSGGPTCASTAAQPSAPARFRVGPRDSPRDRLPGGSGRRSGLGWAAPPWSAGSCRPGSPSRCR